MKKGFLAETTAVLLPEIITVLALNETINQMMIHWDIIFDICVGNLAAGKLMIRSDEAEALEEDKRLLCQEPEVIRYVYMEQNRS